MVPSSVIPMRIPVATPGGTIVVRGHAAGIPYLKDRGFLVFHKPAHFVRCDKGLPLDT